jgi:hypothetical protein
MWLGGAALALTLVALPSAAHAASQGLEPSHAQADVDAAMKDEALPLGRFCREPRLPLSPAARSLCPHATAIPDCAGFAAACAPKDEDGPSFLDRLLRALATHMPNFISRLFRALAALPAAVFLLLVAAVVVAGLIPIARSVRRMKRDAALRPRDERGAKPGEERTDAVETTGEEALLALADRHERDGRSDLALQLYLTASLRALDRRGAVRWAKNRTNGEYVRSCSEEPLRAPLRDIVREVDRVQFGHAPATSDVVSRAAQLATRIVRWLPVVTLVLALPAITGCGGWRGPGAGDDPAGNELFAELLKRQGVRVDALESSLGTLPLPNGPLEPAVIVDAETTALDEDTRSHLVEWAQAGGVLVLAGAPEAWPRAFGAKVHAKPTTGAPGGISAWTQADGPVTPVPYRGAVADPSALDFDVSPDTETESDDDDDRPEGIEPIASIDDGSTYAAVWRSGRGLVLGIASDELTTNAGLARPGNAAALVAILSHANRAAFAIAQPEDGAEASSSPLASLRRAGLGLALGHALVAVLVLFVAVGVRLTAPKPSSPPRRRAFIEHVEAVGALYARTGAARHALASYGRFVEQRLRARMPRGASDLAAYLASRSHVPLAVCERLLGRAGAAAGADAENRPVTDDLMVLKDLSAAYAAATTQDD